MILASLLFVEDQAVIAAELAANRTPDFCMSLDSPPRRIAICGRRFRVRIRPWQARTTLF
jgi:hypothetical protein